MSRVVVVGMGVPASVPARRHAGPGLRATHLVTALQRAGHDVLEIAVLEKGQAAPDLHRGMARPDAANADARAWEGARIEFVREADFSTTELRRRVVSFSPDALVGVTVYGAALALRLRLDLPLWADVFGDLMAEAQAKAARTASDWSLVHFWSLLRPVLEGADRFSAVSVAQSHALVGQLGLAGRLSARTAGEDLVTVIPCSVEATTSGRGRREARQDLGLVEEDFVVLLSGGVNTWCDVETLGRALGLAMSRHPRLHVIVTGGAIPGHDEDSHAELRRHLDSLASSRVHDLGWVDSEELPSLYRAADLALNVERPLYERRLGAENRVIEWLAHGLPCVTTALSECGRQLVEAGLALPCRAGDDEDVAAAILRAAPPVAADLGRRGREWAERERTLSATAAELVRWCDQPVFAGDRDGARLLRLGLVSHPETSAEMLEAYVAALPVREILRRGLRWLVRRGGRALAALSRPRAKGERNRSKTAPGFLPGLVLLASTLLAATLIDGGCKPSGPAPSTGPVNVLLLSIDTLRADHLGAYGYAVRPSPTPWMDSMAAGGRVFEHAVTSAPETAPALATLLTGVYQDRHGVLYNRLSLAEENRTLAERFGEAGYATSGMVGNWLVDAKHGFAQGFDNFEVVTAGAPGATTDDRLVSLFGDFLRSDAADGPWFAWMHMMDPHGAYNSVPPWWSRDFDYAEAPALREGKFPVSSSNFGLGVIPRYQKLDTASSLSDYVRRYDGEIRFTDSQVGAVLGLLAARGLADRTLVVLVADHGESLDEHDELLQHGWFVYDPTVRVPLVLSGPGVGKAARRIDEPTCLVDVAPSLLDLAGIAAEGDDFDGRSFVDVLAGRERPASVTPMSAEAAALRGAGCFSIGPRPNHPFALSTDRYKAIVTPAGAPRDPTAPKGTRSDEPETVEVYDLEADPGERDNLAEARPDLAEGMVASITTLRSRFRAHGWRW